MLVPGLIGQARAPTGRSSIAGQALDSVTGRPIIRLHVCRVFDVGPPFGQEARCAYGDTLGRFSLDSLPAGQHPLQFFCNAEQAFRGGSHDSVTVEVGAAQVRSVSLRLNGTMCDQRPLVVRAGLFRGYYSYGFEESNFHSVADSGYSTWVEMSDTALRSGRPKWPDFPTSVYYPCVYVEWDARLSGPGMYGHMSVSTHELFVYKVRVVRRADPKACRR